MSDHNLRKNERFCYKTYNDTGVKVPLVEENTSNDLHCKTANGMSVEAKVTGELSGLTFQIEEVLDDLQNVNELSLTDLRNNLVELKGLRVEVVKVSSELRILKGEDISKPSNVETQVKDLLSSSKKMMGTLKVAIDAHESRINSENFHNEQRKCTENEAEKRARRFAFDTMVTEIINHIGNLNKKYDTKDDRDMTKEVILKRKELKSSYASELNRLKTLVDRILGYTDVQFDGKERLLNVHLEAVSELDNLKVVFEEKLHSDLEAFDLSDQMIKLATLTKVNIGKFSGSLEKGMDYYTFKSKFLKAYSNHPKSLLVEWLTNNHLEGRARECIGSLDTLDDIWTRLESNFGNVEQLLSYQFKKIHQLGFMYKQKTFEAKMHYLQKLVNIMQDVYDLAVEHMLTGELYYGNHLQKVVTLLENNAQSRWYKIVAEEEVAKPQRWVRMRTFLVSELKIIQIRVSENPADESTDSGRSDDKGRRDRRDRDRDRDHERERSRYENTVNLVQKEQCVLCDEKHPNANNGFLQCRKFLLMSPKQRCEHVRRKKLCLQCLDGKTKWNDSEHSCSDKWVCQHESHNKYEKKLHLLVCEFHTDEENNKKLFQEFKKQVLKAEWQHKLLKDMPSYVVMHDSAYLKKSKENGKNVSMEGDDGVIDASCTGSPVFLLQPVPFNDHVFNIMFDSGCANFVCRKGALDHLPDDCKENIIKGTIIINGVGCNKVTSPHGHYSVKLPLYDSRFAKFNGVCMDIITGAMPPYPVREASKSIVEAYVSQGGKESDLPSVPILVGGETDFLIGIQYNYFQPRLIHMLPTGLGIYESMFLGVDNTRGCIGGPHEVFLQCEKQFVETSSNVVQFKVFLENRIKLFNVRYEGVC